MNNKEYNTYVSHQKELFDEHKKHNLSIREIERYPIYISGVGSFLPTIIAIGIVVTFLLSGVVSYALTKEISADGTHTHWTWFGKYMINEDRHIRSHHFAHPDKCAICKVITEEMNEKKNNN